MAIQVYKWGVDQSGKMTYSANVGGIWRGIDNPNSIPADVLANAPQASGMGTSGGAMSYQDLIQHQTNIDTRAKELSAPQTTYDPAGAQKPLQRPDLANPSTGFQQSVQQPQQPPQAPTSPVAAVSPQQATQQQAQPQQPAIGQKQY